MWIEFARPLMLLLLAPSALALFLMIRRWPLRGGKDRLSAALRVVMIACTVLPLAGASLRAATDQRAAWLLLDASASMADVQDQALALANEALSSARPGQQMGVITFGERAMVEVPLGDGTQFNGVQTQVGASASDFASALALAEALLPSDVSGGIGVISDGRLDPVDGQSLRQRGIEVNALQLTRLEEADAQVSRVELTSTAHQGQMLNVTVTVDSTVDAPATLLFGMGSQVSESREVQLRRGENRFAFQMRADQSGVVTCEAQVLMAGDGVSENNRMAAYVAVSGAPAVLLVEGRAGEGEALEGMLEACGMQVERALPAYMPASAADYGAYRAVALVNVRADAIGSGQIRALESAVRELGCGLAVFGGDESYALGNYRGSALEEMLPVSIDVRNQMELPSTALVLILDQSGSMGDGAYGRSPLEIAKEAACSSVELLLPRDQLGVIAFDDAGKWVWPLGPVEDVAQIQREIGTIRSGGGTAFYTPLAMALEALSAAEAQHKHVIFLTDGAAGDSGYEGLAREMAQRGISLTTVAVGSGADVKRLKDLAELGGGRSYVAGEFDDVPKIFIQETMQVSEAYVQNRVFTPVVTDASLTDFEGFPQLAGYLTTAAKPLATVSLISDREDPILAWWPYGAGRVLCWTSDVRGAWTQAYLNWDSAAAFFGGMLNQVLSNWNASGEMQLEGGVLRYTAPQDAQNASVTAKIIAPDGSAREVEMEQISPDRYEARVDAREPGAYAVHIQARRDGEVLCALDGGGVIPYAREYDLRVGDVGALDKISADTGGARVEDAAALMHFQSRDVRARHDLTPWLMAAALILLVADIAQRRFNWERALVRQNRPGHSPRRPPKRPRPASRRDRPDAPKPAETSERLWQNLQNRNRM